MKTTNIQVYGHSPGGEGFFNCYRDLCRDYGVPSVLRRYNAQELKSNRVLDFNREHLIKDEFLEVEDQQQNVVESGGIRWLKSAIHVLLDMTGAPAWIWFLAETYLADVHNHTWNNEREFIKLLQHEMELLKIYQGYYNLYFGKEYCILIMSMHSHNQRNVQVTL
jgi:hypothetical protein